MRIDLNLLDGLSFESFKNYDHRLGCLTIKLDKPKVRMSGYWKFIASLLDEKNFQGQLEY